MSVIEECEKNLDHFRKENLLVGLGLAVLLYLPRRFNMVLLKIFIHFSFLHFTPQEHFFLGRLPFFLQPHICYTKTNMSLILRYRKPVLAEKLKEENVKQAFPQYQNTNKFYIDYKGNFHKKWAPPVASAYNRPIKKIHYNLWADTTSLWPK